MSTNPKPLDVSRVFVLVQVHARHRPELLEQCLELAFCHAISQVANIYIHFVPLVIIL